MSCQAFEALIALYVEGDLPGRDTPRVEEHLASGCPLCQAALAEFSDASVLLAASAPAALPGPTLRQRVLAAVATPGIPEPEPPAPDETNEGDEEDDDGDTEPDESG